MIIFIFGVQEFVNNKYRIDCGTYSSYIGKGVEMIEDDSSKINALTCFNSKDNECIIEHEYIIEAFYFPDNKLVRNRNCNGLSIENF